MDTLYHSLEVANVGMGTAAFGGNTNEMDPDSDFLSHKILQILFKNKMLLHAPSKKNFFFFIWSVG